VSSSAPSRVTSEASSQRWLQGPAELARRGPAGRDRGRGGPVLRSGGSGTSQRPIDPLPGEVVDDRGTSAGSRRRSCRTRSRERAAASALSRRSSHSGLTRIASTVVTPLSEGVCHGSGRRGPVGERLAPLPSRAAQPPAQVGVLEPGAQRASRNAAGSSGGTEQTRPGAVGAVPEPPAHRRRRRRRPACGPAPRRDDHPVRLRATAAPASAALWLPAGSGS
jgi:hypothetical protein